MTKTMSSDVGIAYLVILGITLAAASPLPIPVCLHMIVIAMAIIYIGSMNAAKEAPEGEEKEVEMMTSKDAYMFPIIGSCVLFSLFLVLKVLPKEYVNMVVKCYFFVFGVIVLGGQFATLLESVLLPEATTKSLTATEWSFVLPAFMASKKPEERKDKKPESVKFTPLNLVGCSFSLIVGVLYLTHNHWTASNAFGAAFSIQGVEMLNLTSYKNGLVLLSGLFIYDIFWVFGTEVMVSVAKGFDVPIKLLFPQMWEGKPSMLGLGDIVIPGIFIALVYRFDVANKSGRTYFNTVMIAYFVGLATTVGVMYFFNAAQPALLYLVPACLGSTIIQAFLRGEWSKIFAYTEEAETKEEGRGETKKAQ